MTLRKITIDNSVRYIPKNEQTTSKKQSDKIQPIFRWRQIKHEKTKQKLFKK